MKNKTKSWEPFRSCLLNSTANPAQFNKLWQDFSHTFSMALYHKWDVKNDLVYVLQFFSLISDSLGSVTRELWIELHNVNSNLLSINQRQIRTTLRQHASFV